MFKFFRNIRCLYLIWKNAHNYEDTDYRDYMVKVTETAIHFATDICNSSNCIDRFIECINNSARRDRKQVAYLIRSLRSAKEANNSLAIANFMTSIHMLAQEAGRRAAAEYNGFSAVS